MRSTRTLVLLATMVLVALLGSRSAHAGDEERARALLERARVAEQVEHDPDRALDLLRQAEAASGDGATARDALLSLARLHEARGEASLAISALERATARTAAHMQESQKLAVHEALLRLLPPGSRARSPLAEILVRGEVQLASSTSPLERKIEDLLSQLDGSDALVWQERQNLEQNLRRSLDPLGADALPVLARIVRGARPERARFAAELMAGLGGEQALDELIRAASEGDGFTRAAALAGLKALRREQDISERLLAGLTRLRRYPEIERQYGSSLLRLEMGHASAEEAMRRHREQETENLDWLSVALSREAPRALERTLDLAAQPGAVGDRALALLGPLAFPTREGEAPRLAPEQLPPAVAERMLDAHLRLKLQGSVPQVLAQLVRLVGRLKGPEAQEAAAEAAWRRILEEGQGARDLALRLREAQVAVPASLARDSVFVATALLTPGLNANAWQPLLLEGEGFLRALQQAVNLAPTQEQAGSLLHMLRSVRDLPEALDSGWVETLSKRAPFPFSVPDCVWTAMWRSADPRMRDILQAHSTPDQFGHLRAMLRQLDASPLELRFAILKDLLSDLRYDPAINEAIALLGGAGERGRELLQGFARRPEHPHAHLAVNMLKSADDVPFLTALCEELATRPSLSEVPNTYRHALIAAVKRLHVREAFPYLLREYRDGVASEAAGAAMASIREYHEHLAEFEAFSKGAASVARDVVHLLKDEDPEIRRGAVLAIAALGRKEAVGELLRLAKEDPAPRVREAALAAVERLAIPTQEKSAPK